MIRSKLAQILAASTLVLGATAAQAQDKQLTLCWVAWDPANALAELSKDFTAKSGIRMKVEFVPWTSFADRFINELNSHGKLCDLLIGDSQWIGGGATYGHYIKLNDFFDQNGISMDDFLPATVYAYSTWPKGTPNYCALPAMGDALGWVYRKDWFARPEIREAFKAQSSTARSSCCSGAPAAARPRRCAINLVPVDAFGPIAAPAEAATIGIRPENVLIGRGGRAATVRQVEHLGAETVVLLEVASRQLHALAGPGSAVQPGATTTVDPALDAALFFGADGRRLPASASASAEVGAGESVHGG